MSGIEKKDIPPIDLVIHKQRVGQELIFQTLLSCKAVEDTKVSDLRALSREIWVAISNFLYDLDMKKLNVIVNDKRANDPRFITDIIQHYLTED